MGTTILGRVTERSVSTENDIRIVDSETAGRISGGRGESDTGSGVEGGIIFRKTGFACGCGIGQIAVDHDRIAISDTIEIVSKVSNGLLQEQLGTGFNGPFCPVSAAVSVIFAKIINIVQHVFAAENDIAGNADIAHDRGIFEDGAF